MERIRWTECRLLRSICSHAQVAATCHIVQAHRRVSARCAHVESKAGRDREFLQRADNVTGSSGNRSRSSYIHRICARRDGAACKGKEIVYVDAGGKGYRSCTGMSDCQVVEGVARSTSDCLRVVIAVEVYGVGVWC